IVLAALFGESGCKGDSDTSCVSDEPAPSYVATLRVVDEKGAPVPGAVVVRAGGVGVPAPVDSNGQLALGPETAPVALVASAEGYLAEPAVVGPEDDGKTVTVRMLARGAHRFVMHSVGDVMLGRRYEDPGDGK